MRFLCIGYGSVGRKHASILRDMGHTVIVVDPISEDADFRHVDDVCDPDLLINGTLDCTPADVRAGWEYATLHRFIEKPLGQNYPHTADAYTRGAFLGFVYRWLPSLEQFVQSLASVRVYSVLIVSGQWLPDWHPGEDYRKRYHGVPGRGGIVLDSLPHSFYIARWMLGDVKVVGSVVGKLSGLEIQTPDTASVLLRAPTGQSVHILADYLRDPHAFYIEVVTSNGLIRWRFDPDEADVMYRRQMEAWCNVCAGKMQYGYPSMIDGMAVQELLEAIT